jgi:hypothetical protein
MLGKILTSIPKRCLREERAGVLHIDVPLNSMAVWANPYHPITRSFVTPESKQYARVCYTLCIDCLLDQSSQPLIVPQ